MIEDMKQKIGEVLPKKRIFVLLGIGIFILFMIGLIKFGNLFAFLWLFPWISEKIAFSVGINVWLARAIGVVMAT